MRHYDPQEVFGWIAFCNRVKCVPLDYYDKFMALINQANAAHEAELEKERMMGLLLESEVHDLAENDK